MTTTNTTTTTNTQAIAREQALREYEAAHAVWMNTSVFTEEGKEAKRKLAEARAKFTACTAKGQQ